MYSCYNVILQDMMWKNTIPRILRKGGLSLVYSALLLFYAFKRSDLPVWARSIIIGALGYLLTPIDSVPDLTPILGYTDDLGILSYALVMIAAYINDEVRQKAQRKFHALTHSPFNAEAIAQVEKFL